MTLIVVHGDDTEKVADRLLAFIASAHKRDFLITHGDVATLLRTRPTASLFGKDQLFVIEGITGVKKDQITKLISDNSTATFVFVSNTKLSVLQTKLFPDSAKFEVYELSKALFTFLDSIKPGAQREIVTLFRKVLLTQNPELVFALVCRRFKDLYWVLTSPSNISYPSWIVGKLERQAKFFKVSQLKSLLGKLLAIDIKVKSTSENLTPLLDDFFLITLK